MYLKIKKVICLFFLCFEANKINRIHFIKVNNRIYSYKTNLLNELITKIKKYANSINVNDDIFSSYVKY